MGKGISSVWFSGKWMPRDSEEYKQFMESKACERLKWKEAGLGREGSGNGPEKVSARTAGGPEQSLPVGRVLGMGHSWPVTVSLL